VDGLVGGFVRQATDWKSLAAVTVGGMAYRAGRMGAMGLGSGNFTRAASVGLGLTAEVSAFELTHRGLSTVFRRGGPMWPPAIGSESGHPHGGAPTNNFERNLWRWSGPGGLRQGFLQSLVTFGALKGAGSLAQGENVFVQHLLQDTAMVAGHQASWALGLAERPRGSLAEQFLRAEATNLQIGAGMTLAHRFAPGVTALERGLDLSMPMTNVGAGFPRPQLGGRETGEETSPLQMQNGLQPALAVAGEGRGLQIGKERSPENGPTILRMESHSDASSEASGTKSFWERRDEIASQLGPYDGAHERMRKGEDLSPGEKEILVDTRISELRREREIKDLALEDLSHFAAPLSHVGAVRGLRKDLEALYLEGVEMKSTRGDEPFSLNNFSTKPVNHNDYQAYQLWRRRMSLPWVSEPRTWLNDGMRRLNRFLGRRPMDLEGQASPSEAYYLLSLLEMLPPSFYRTDYLWGLTLGSNRDLTESRYDSGNVEIFLGEATMAGMPREPVVRRNLMGVLFHEFGHSVAARYALTRDENYTDDSLERLPPDSSIPMRVRRKMHESFDVIRGLSSGQNFVFSLGFIETAEKRRKFISERENPFVIREFISEHVLHHLAAGDALRLHISKIPDLKARNSYQWIYNEIRDRVFEGNEYSRGYRTGIAPVLAPNGR